MKITKDLFVWKIITHKQVSDIFHLNLFPVYKLNEDDSKVMIESEEELLEAYYEKAVMGIEVGQLDFHDLAKKQDIIPVFWSKNDIVDFESDEELANKEVDEIFDELAQRHDAEIGINWDVIRSYKQQKIDERSENHSN